VIVFMIAHDEDHVWEPCTTALKELMVSSATIIWTHDVVGITLCNIVGHTDVAAQDQDFRVVLVVKVQVTKFKM